MNICINIYLLEYRSLALRYNNLFGSLLIVASLEDGLIDQL